MYVKVKWEEKRPTEIFHLDVPTAKDVDIFSPLVKMIIARQGNKSLGQRRLVCIDDEGDEVLIRDHKGFFRVLDSMGYYSTPNLDLDSRITVVVKKNVDTPECTLDEQQFTERPTGLSIDSEPSHGVQASTLQHNASSPNDLIEVLTKALSLAERMAGSVFINPSASSSHSHDEDEEPALFDSMATEGFSAAGEESQSDVGSVVHEMVVCDKCQMHPLIGNRYKCAIRPDYDLCESCQETDNSPFPYLKIKHPSQAPAAICCILRDSKHSSGHTSSTLWNKQRQQQQQSTYACTTTNDVERGLSNVLRSINEFTGDSCRWLSGKVREKRDRLKNNGTRIVKDGMKDGNSNYHHRRKMKNKSTQHQCKMKQKSSQQIFCDDNENIITGAQCLVSGEDDHLSIDDVEPDDVEPEEPPVYIEKEESLTSEAIATSTFKNQSTTGPGCSKDVTPNSEGTSMAAESVVASDDCNAPSSVKDNNSFRPSMVRFIEDVSVPALTSISPGKPFVKAWQLRYNGPGRVPEDTRLVWVSGDKMGVGVGYERYGYPSRHYGSYFVVSIRLMAPVILGRYIGYWSLSSPSTGTFGPQLMTDIVVNCEEDDDWVRVGSD